MTSNQDPEAAAGAVDGDTGVGAADATKDADAVVVDLIIAISLRC